MLSFHGHFKKTHPFHIISVQAPAKTPTRKRWTSQPRFLSSFWTSTTLRRRRVAPREEPEREEVKAPRNGSLWWRKIDVSKIGKKKRNMFFLVSQSTTSLFWLILLDLIGLALCIFSEGDPKEELVWLSITLEAQNSVNLSKIYRYTELQVT